MVGSSVEWPLQRRHALVDAPPGMYPQLAAELRASGTGGNLSTDTFLAVLARALDATLCSADNDCRRYKNLKYYNPGLES